MNTELKTKWLEALRSGKYEQGFKRLCNIRDNKERYCCLGVLCDIYDSTKWQINSYIEYQTKTYGGWQGSITTPLLEVYGMSRTDSEVLVKMNDLEGKSFNEIADWIDQNL